MPIEASMCAHEISMSLFIPICNPAPPRAPYTNPVILLHLQVTNLPVLHRHFSNEFICEIKYMIAWTIQSNRAIERSRPMPFRLLIHDTVTMRLKKNVIPANHPPHCLYHYQLPPIP